MSHLTRHKRINNIYMHLFLCPSFSCALILRQNTRFVIVSVVVISGEKMWHKLTQISIKFRGFFGSLQNQFYFNSKRKLQTTPFSNKSLAHHFNVKTKTISKDLFYRFYASLTMFHSQE